MAFPRSPTILAQIAWDLARFSKGRFILGLGTQVKGHNERRFGVKWEKPVEKMRDVILAVSAVWESWQHQTRLNYQGEFYKLTLMTRSSVRRRMNIRAFRSSSPASIAACASSPANYAKAFMSIRCTPNVICARDLPNIEIGLAKSGQAASSDRTFEQYFRDSHRRHGQAAKYEAECAEQIAFYASTPPYRPVFDLEGWGERCAIIFGEIKERHNCVTAVVVTKVIDM